jgi:hypothetical protein
MQHQGMIANFLFFSFCKVGIIDRSSIKGEYNRYEGYNIGAMGSNERRNSNEASVQVNDCIEKRKCHPV